MEDLVMNEGGCCCKTVDRLGISVHPTKIDAAMIPEHQHADSGRGQGRHDK